MGYEWVGLVPAAGRGLRLGLPYPKELYPIISNNRYKPVSQFIVDQIRLANIQHIVFVINETKHQFIGFYGSGKRFSCNFSYVVQETRELREESTSPGLADAIDSSYHLIKEKNIVFGMADTIIRPADMVDQAKRSFSDDMDVMLCLFSTSTPQKFGMVDVDVSNRVSKIVDKPLTTDLTSMWGSILWAPKFTEYVHKMVQVEGLSDFALIMNSAIAEGMKIRGLKIEGGTFFDLGTYAEIVALDAQIRTANEY